MKHITLFRAHNLSNGIIHLPGSKSESNRALLVNALCETSGNIDNLAIARDTQIMQALIATDDSKFNAQDAGTVMRFMTAYLAVTKNNTEITGSGHMKKRPIGILVEALRSLGVEISYLEKEGFPPLKIGGLSKQESSFIEVASNVSSQYISALLMIGPKLPQGLTLKLKGDPVSTPYIDMTVSIMQHFGVKVDVVEQSYKVEPQLYTFKPFQVESDWSGASYWYSIFALSNLQELTLAGLKANSFQGDSMIATLMEKFGVVTRFEGNTAILTQQEADLPKEIDFIKCPDLAQTFAVLCATLGHKCTFLGLQTLKIKETDRVKAIKIELQKVGGDFIEEDNKWILIPIPAEKLPEIREVSIKTYDDHRMAMAFAALATKMDVHFDNSAVVNKSYPTFWDDLKRLGFRSE
ncbi:MAG: 3-phosphoshikimate 1-carboxyvinyltransferase [Bacteroidetes bacterium]|nr:MAG: 3-phosphoshikimate 1-carboxyvinyltransferase [Bacteroidota bacterium]